MKRFWATVITLTLVLGIIFTATAFAQDTETDDTAPATPAATQYRFGRNQNQSDNSAWTFSRGAARMQGMNHRGMMGTQNNRANFVDENEDSVCDNFVDEDGDGVCDNCPQGGKKGATQMGRRSMMGGRGMWGSDSVGGRSMMRGRGMMGRWVEAPESNE
jgi:hypothetical protein